MVAVSHEVRIPDFVQFHWGKGFQLVQCLVEPFPPFLIRTLLREESAREILVSSLATDYFIQWHDLSSHFADAPVTNQPQHLVKWHQVVVLSKYPRPPALHSAFPTHLVELIFCFSRRVWQSRIWHVAIYLLYSWDWQHRVKP